MYSLLDEIGLDEMAINPFYIELVVLFSATDIPALALLLGPRPTAMDSSNSLHCADIRVLFVDGTNPFQLLCLL